MKEASQLNVSLRGADRSWTRLSKTVLTFVLAPRVKAQEQCKVEPIIAFEQRKYFKNEMEISKVVSLLKYTTYLQCVRV